MLPNEKQYKNSLHLATGIIFIITYQRLNLTFCYWNSFKLAGRNVECKQGSIR